MITKAEIKKISWYVQAGAASPVGIGVPLLSIGEEHPGTFSFPQDSSYLEKNEKGFQVYHHFDKEETKKLACQIFQRYEERPELFLEIEQRMIRLGKELETAGLALTERELDPGFADDYHAVFRMAIAVWQDSYFPDFFDVDEELNFSLIFGTELPDRETILKLMVTPSPGLVQAEQISFLELCIALKDGKDANKLLEQHAKEYWFITNDFETSTKLTAEDFKKKAEDLLAKPGGYDALESEMENAARLREEAAELRQGLAADVRKRLDFFLWSALFRDVRKKYAQIMNYVQLTIAKKVAARDGVPLETVMWLLPDELEDAITNGVAVYKNKIANREKHGLFFYTKRAGEQDRVSGEEARDLFDAITNTFLSDEAITGNPASAGTAQGTVRIMLNQADFHRFKKGDILVAPMTRPEYVPLMKKAAAIVTDEGGLTCHAAVVSRELGKPCVIGTQVASRVLTDGAHVEVDANKGTVRRV